MKRALVDLLILGGAALFAGYLLAVFFAERSYLAGERKKAGGDLPAALLAFDEAAELLPFRGEYQRAVGDANFHLYSPVIGNRRPLFAAVSAYQRMLENDPRYPYGWFELGQVRYELRKARTDQPSPGPELARAVEIDPTNPKFLAGLLEWQIEAGPRSAARATFFKLVQSDPQGIPGFGPKLLLTADDRNQFARQLGDHPQALLEYARFLADHGRPELAQTQLDRIPEGERSDREIAGPFAEVLLKIGKPEEAKALLGRALKAHPGDPGLSQQMAAQLVKENDLPGAIAVYEDVLNHNPDEWLINMEIGRLAMTAGLFDLAWQYFTAALDSGYTNSPLKLECFIARGRIKEQRGELGAALGEYEKVLEIDPNNATIRQAARLLRAKLGTFGPGP